MSNALEFGKNFTSFKNDEVDSVQDFLNLFIEIHIFSHILHGNHSNLLNYLSIFANIFYGNSH